MDPWVVLSGAGLASGLGLLLRSPLARTLCEAPLEAVRRDSELARIREQGRADALLERERRKTEIAREREYRMTLLAVAWSLRAASAAGQDDQSATVPSTPADTLVRHDAKAIDQAPSQLTAGGGRCRAAGAT
jgi:hypothetical protein